MKKISALLFILSLPTLAGCYVEFTPPQRHPATEVLIYSQPALYQGYTPPIDYSPPRGAWYPWGNLNSGHGKGGHHKSHDQKGDRGGNRGDQRNDRGDRGRGDHRRH